VPVEEADRARVGGARLPDGCAMFGCTFAARGGIRPASRFEFELKTRVLKRADRAWLDVIEVRCWVRN